MRAKFKARKYTITLWDYTTSTVTGYHGVSSGQSCTLALNSMNENRPRKERQKYEIYSMAVRLEVVRLVESGHLHR